MTSHAIFVKMSQRTLLVSRVAQKKISQGLLYFRYVLRSPVLFLVVTLTLFINLSDMIVWLFDALKRFSDSDRIELHLTELISNATLPPRSVARSCHLITNSAKSVILWKINCNSCSFVILFIHRAVIVFTSLVNWLASWVREMCEKSATFRYLGNHSSIGAVR